mgnify:CR=1 FL=1
MASLHFSHLTAKPFPEGLRRTDKKSAFETLCRKFSISDAVLQLFMRSPMEGLDDFRLYFDDEDQIDIFVARISDLRGSALRIQVARVRSAWSAVRQKSGG